MNTAGDETNIQSTSNESYLKQIPFLLFPS